VDQDHGRAAADRPVDHPVAVQLDLPSLEVAPVSLSHSAGTLVTRRPALPAAAS